MEVNFVESNPIPVKAAMAHDGPAANRSSACRWCRRRRRISAKIEAVLKAGRTARGALAELRMQTEIEQLFDHKPAAYTRRTFRAVSAFQSTR